MMNNDPVRRRRTHLLLTLFNLRAQSEPVDLRRLAFELSAEQIQIDRDLQYLQAMGWVTRATLSLTMGGLVVAASLRRARAALAA